MAKLTKLAIGFAMILILICESFFSWIITSDIPIDFSRSEEIHYYLIVAVVIFVGIFSFLYNLKYHCINYAAFVFKIIFLAMKIISLVSLKNLVYLVIPAAFHITYVGMACVIVLLILDTILFARNILNKNKQHTKRK